MEHPSLHRFVISCEHAHNSIPDRFAHLFIGSEKELASHRGWDPGAIILAHTISNPLQSPLFIYPFTRLLIEPNRSEHHPNLFSEFSRQLSVNEKKYLIEQYYRPYRKSVEERITDLIEQQIVPIHLSIHTFTPLLNGVVRDFDIGLLYDPSRTSEKLFSDRWKRFINQEHGNIRIKMNQPYKGRSDGLTTTLRRKFKEKYIGIELEVNQKHFYKGNEHWNQLCKRISDGLLHIHTTV